MSLVLHGYWRSSAAYRVRIALNLKGLEYRQVTHDLRHGEQRAPDYLEIAPHGLVPTLVHDGGALIESPAILEWLDARYPNVPLLPADPDKAAIVRAMAAVIGCDIHPINNLRVLDVLRQDFGADQAQIGTWMTHWIDAGFTALEQLIARHGGTFAFGDAPGMVDCYLVPQVYNAERFAIDLSAYPRLQAATEAARALPAVAAAHPAMQPDAQG
ncbi:maleylpyruvate isomerase [Novosphingobium chloroacetimidivorans]|uniref:Maleylpyruvate isomerase n=1 Tax=Novosphingobium chloroacetimidivorans TaxID=1428314 RepID=A0A7W7K9F8_9SPHN|nr:maleylacetoacetate isomerase [Novosphingobium chloroacetimidivorans]MBB4857973.1 maleylpyruvate isomerase [Novosphingobium chloroacetimidivorans]